jgi:SNF family Na+-dependent transporter
MKYFGYLVFAWSLSAFADLKTIFTSSHGLPWSTIRPWTGESGITRFFSSIVSMLQDITAIVSVLGICIVGIMYIMSRWDEEKTENAKKYMIAILVGLILALSAWAIIAMVDLIPTSIQF